MLQLLTVHEAAEQLTVSVKTVRRMIDKGELDAVRIGRSVRIEQSELDSILNRRRTRTRSAAAPPLPRTEGQNRALHGKAADLAKLREVTKDQIKQDALRAASIRFGRIIGSTTQLTRDEASEVLDWLEEELEHERSSATQNP